MERDGDSVSGDRCRVGAGVLARTTHARVANNLLFSRPSSGRASRASPRFHLCGGVGGASESLFEFELRFDEGGLVKSALGKEIPR